IEYMVINNYQLHMGWYGLQIHSHEPYSSTHTHTHSHLHTHIHTHTHTHTYRYAHSNVKSALSDPQWVPSRGLEPHQHEGCVCARVCVSVHVCVCVCVCVSECVGYLTNADQCVRICS